jgi:hypothetical protein
MAFVVLRSSRATRSYYLVESYRDEAGKSRKRTLCYLGREADGVETLEKALAHWQRQRTQALRSCNAYRGERRQALRRKLEAIEAKLALIRLHLEKRQAEEAARRERERQAEEAAHWQAFALLRREPCEEHYRAAKRAFRRLALRYHPDQGGDHAAFVRMRRAYDEAVSRYQSAA